MKKYFLPAVILILAASLAAVLLISGRPDNEPVTNYPPAETTGQLDAHSLAREITYAYRDRPDEAAEIAETNIEAMRGIDADLAEQWTKVTDFWNYTRNGMPVNIGELPGNLPQDGSLCIVVLGFELNFDGTMQDELIGRLETALRCGEQYPNAYLVCTGGGTAIGNPNVTEAGLMGDWLLEHGLDEKRLLIEDRSMSTAENAKFTYELVSEQAPEVTDLAIVSSSYHIAWGSLLFQTELIKMGVDDSMSVVSNAAYDFINDRYANNTYYYEASGVMAIMEGE